jgi:hypothetical protein
MKEEGCHYQCLIAMSVVVVAVAMSVAMSVAMVVAMVVVLLPTMAGLVGRIQSNKFKFELVMGVLDRF